MRKNGVKSVDENLVKETFAAISKLTDSLLEYTMDFDKDIDEVGKLYVEILELKEELSVGVSVVEDLMNKLMAVSEILSVEDAGVAIEKVQGQSRVKWDNDTVRSVLSEKIVGQFVDPETGTLTVPPSRLIDEAFNVTGIRWKVTELRRLGMNPDNYSEKKEGKISFRIASSTHVEKDQSDDNEDFI
jgi:hypothetical protein